MEDPRYKVAHKEALIGVALAVFNFIWWYGFAYGLGGRPISHYHYIFGFPAWFFYSCILGFIIVTLLLVLVVKFLFTDIPLDDEPRKEGEDKK